MIIKNTSTTPRTARHARPWLAIAPLAVLPLAFAQDMVMAPGVNVPRFPPVPAFAEGGTLFFIHSETFDPEVSQTLSLMMGSPVVTVPALAETPPEVLADLYVFTNGVQGGTEDVPMLGPFGFQLAVFDGVPGEEDYSPPASLEPGDLERPLSGPGAPLGR